MNPVYLAAVVAYSTTWPQLEAGLLGTVPLFVALGIARLLVVALPGGASPGVSSTRSINCSAPR